MACPTSAGHGVEIDHLGPHRGAYCLVPPLMPQHDPVAIRVKFRAVDSVRMRVRNYQGDQMRLSIIIHDL